MNLLIAGLVLWTVAHFFKRLAPEMRAGMDAKLGKGPAKGVMGIILVGAVVMMVKGYGAAPVNIVYAGPEWLRYLNNLLMIEAVLLMGMGSSKGRARTWVRHPMLVGVIVWAGAHLLVNGDVASIVLFGGLALWAMASMVLINQQEGPWKKPEAGPVSGDIKWVVISAVVFIVIGGLHIWLGPNPFGG